MTTGSYSRKKGMKAIRIGYIDLVSWGSSFLTNQDLLKQFYFNLSVNDYDQSTFYTHDPCVIYTNYPSITATLDNIDIYTIVASPTLHDSTQALYDACYWIQTRITSISSTLFLSYKTSIITTLLLKTMTTSNLMWMLMDTVNSWFLVVITIIYCNKKISGFIIIVYYKYYSKSISSEGLH